MKKRKEEKEKGKRINFPSRAIGEQKFPSWESLAWRLTPRRAIVYDGGGVVAYVVDVSNRRHGYVNFIAPLYSMPELVNLSRRGNARGATRVRVTPVPRSAVRYRCVRLPGPRNGNWSIMLTAGVDAENKREELGGEQRLEARRNHIGETKLNLRECVQRVGGGKMFSKHRERERENVARNISNNISIKRKSRFDYLFRSLFSIFLVDGLVNSKKIEYIVFIKKRRSNFVRGFKKL